MVLVVPNFSAFSDIIFSKRLFTDVRVKYGADAEQRVKDWQQTLMRNAGEDVDEQLYAINRFFNRLKFVDDIEHWRKEDYWATPLEFLSTNAGDCEDFTIAKYFSLRELGVPAEK